MPRVTVPTYCNELEEIAPFSNKEAAKAWLEQEKLTNDGVTLLVPFQDELRKIRFLKPENKRPALNRKLRMIGMDNHEEESSRWQKFVEGMERAVGIDKCRVPRFNQLEGEAIVPAEPHGYLIVYEKGEKDVGEFFYAIFNKLSVELIERARLSYSNDPNLYINSRVLMDDLSRLTVGKLENKSVACDIRSGRIYFIIEDRLYRYTFKKNPSNDREEVYLRAEAKYKLAKKIVAYTEKNINHHYWEAVRGYLRVILLAAPLALVPGALIFGFLMLAGAPILIPAACAAAIAAFIAFWVMNKGFREVRKQTKNTVDYGKTTFKHLSVSIFTEFKNDLKIIHAAVFGKISEQAKKGLAPLVSDSMENLSGVSDAENTIRSFSSPQTLTTVLPFPVTPIAVSKSTEIHHSPDKQSPCLSKKAHFFKEKSGYSKGKIVKGNELSIQKKSEDIEVNNDHSIFLHSAFTQ